MIKSNINKGSHLVTEFKLSPVIEDYLRTAITVRENLRKIRLLANSFREILISIENT